jgi:hypothetical protein
VVISGSPDYLDKLAEAGDLGGSDTFQELVPESGDAASVFFVNFDAGDGWLDDLVHSLGAPDDLEENLRPLRAIGMSSWVEDGEQHSLLKVTTE